MKSIDLGMSYDEMMPETPKEREKHYPSFHYDGPEGLDLPHEGEMTVRFKKTSSSVSERDGKKHYSCTVEVQSIEDVEADSDESPTKSYDEAGPALDKLMKKKKGY